MISLSCDFYIPTGLKQLLNDNDNLPSFLRTFTFSCEINITKNTLNEENSEKLSLQKPIVTPSPAHKTWHKVSHLIQDGMKLFNEDLQLSVKIGLEFPTNGVEEKEDLTKAILPALNNNNEDREYHDQEKTELYLEKNNKLLNIENRTEDEPELVKETRRILSLNRCDSVELCSQGIGGTYFISNEARERIAVFKPNDEEPGSDGNPKGLIPDPLLPPGGGSIREVAAYLVDQGFAGVPETYFVSGLKHPAFNSVKSGSLQRYIPNTEDSSEISSSRYSVPDVHKIGILDIRLYNMDRNSENLLIQNPKNPKLIPIDHTYVLPHELSFLWFEWLHWKQAKQPFSPELLEYIKSIDIEKDTAILRQLGMDEAPIRTMVISTSLLKIAAIKFGYNLFQIGSIVSQKNINEESQLEKMVKKTEAMINGDKDQFLEVLSQVIEEELKI